MFFVLAYRPPYLFNRRKRSQGIYLAESVGGFHNSLPGENVLASIMTISNPVMPFPIM
jgi:hypothetical protein